MVFPNAMQKNKQFNMAFYQTVYIATDKLKP